MTFSVLPDKEDDILTRGRKIGFIGTTSVWLAFILVSSFFPFFRKNPEYKTVHITIASAPVEKPVEKIEPLKEVAIANIEQTDQVLPQKKAEPAKKISASPKKEPTPQIKESAPVKPAAVYKKSVEELMAEQSMQKSKDKDIKWDDSLFVDSPAASSTTNSTAQVKQIAGAAALSGSSAAAVQRDNGPVSSTSAEKNKNTGSADSSTQAALGAIRETRYTQPSGNGVSSQTSLKTGSSPDGKVAIGMSDGTARVLLYPSKPAIQISDENAKQIDSRRTVTVKFKVLAGGNVPLSEIFIEPDSILTSGIKTEIRGQVSRWRFAQDTSDGAASFIFTIDFKK
jgi:hypothetical protein